MNIIEALSFTNSNSFNDQILNIQYDLLNESKINFDSFSNNLNITNIDNDQIIIIPQMKQIIDNMPICFKYKMYYKSIIDRYLYYYNNDFKLLNCNYFDNIEIRKNQLLFPNNFYFYFRFILKFKNEHLKRVCNFFLKILKIQTNNPNLNFIGITIPKRIKLAKKKIIYKRIILFINYLYINKNFKNLLIFELIFKFNAHIGGIAKMKLKDISKGYIGIHVKNKGIFFYKDIQCYKRLKEYASKLNLKMNNYIFIENNSKNLKSEINKINRNFNNTIKRSNLFSDLNLPRQTSEIFRENNIFGHINIKLNEKENGKKKLKNIVKINFHMKMKKNNYNKIFKYIII